MSRPPFKRDLIQTGRSISYATGLHPNPRLYKYYWQVFTLDSDWEGPEFREKASPLCTSACMLKLDELTLSNSLYVLYGWKRPRRFPGMPFDPNSERWKDAQWAPALEDDSDPEWSGHR